MTPDSTEIQALKRLFGPLSQIPPEERDRADCRAALADAGYFAEELERRLRRAVDTTMDRAIHDEALRMAEHAKLLGHWVDKLYRRS